MGVRVGVWVSVGVGDDVGVGVGVAVCVGDGVEVGVGVEGTTQPSARVQGSTSATVGLPSMPV